MRLSDLEAAGWCRIWLSTHNPHSSTDNEAQLDLLSYSSVPPAVSSRCVRALTNAPCDREAQCACSEVRTISAPVANRVAPLAHTPSTTIAMRRRRTRGEERD